MESEQDKMSTEAAVLEALDKRPMTYAELMEETGIRLTALEYAIRTLKAAGEVEFDLMDAGRGWKTKKWRIADNPPESDFTPNAPYEGPSYTHFLQGIWNDRTPTNQSPAAQA